MQILPKIREKEVRESKVLLLELTRECVIPLVGVNDQGGVVAQGVGINIEVDVEAQALVADKPKKFRKMKTVNGASGSGHPLKRLREDYGTSGDAGASTAGKSFAALQDLLDKSTLAAEIGVTSAATIPFVTSSVTPTPEHEGGEYTDFVFAANFPTKRLAERFVISLDTPHDSNENAADDEVSSVVREVNEPTRASIFSYSTTVGNVGPDVARPSQMAGNDISSESFYVSLDMDSETLHQTYVPKWDVLNESALDEPNVCRSLVDQLAPPVFFSQLHPMEYDQLFAEFNVGAATQTCLGAKVRERDTEIAGLKAQLSLKEADAAEAIHLRSRIANIEAVDATLTGELKSLKERNAALESVVVAKDSEIAKLTQALSSLQLSCDDLSIKDSTLECEKDKLVDHVSELEATCSGLRDEVAGYKLFKEQVETVQDEQVKALSDRGFSAAALNLRVQRLKGGDAVCRLSVTDVMVLLLEPLSVRSLTGEAITSMVPSTTVTTALSTTFVQASTIPPVPSTEVPPSPKIVFEEELDTTPEHASAP
ncbi:hypothetical protein Tco_1057899 [Tanacetum coccineum]|uniref:Uncharacterized protein n=1 Tax=Tanacetum coccineum TaxID=301880 RepID=A0ABQ5H8K5_9ASTR